MVPDWSAVLSRYTSPTLLATRARGRPFEVRSSGAVLVVTPSSGHPRRISEHEFARNWERAALLEPGTDWRRATQNSSYLESIAADLATLAVADAAGSAVAPIALAPGDSLEQREAERLIIAALSVELDVPLQPGRFQLDGGLRVTVDGYAELPPVLVEAWAHQGRAKPAQRAKVMGDALKLLWLQRAQFPAGAHKILVLSDSDAAKPFVNPKTWLARALRDLEIEVRVVELPAEVRKRLRDAQKRQRR